MIKPPIALKKPKDLEIHQHKRTDPYYWMKLSDEQKNALEVDQQTYDVLQYLKAENAYTDQVMEDTKAFQEKLFNEITGRIKKDDSTVPYFKNGYWYYTRYEDTKEYPIYCRKAKTLDDREEILLDVNEQAVGHDYYHIGSLDISPDNKILAYFEDTVSRRVYTIRFKNLESGEILDDVIHNAAPGGAWANDHKTFFYTSKNTVSLLSEKIWRHQLGNLQDSDELVYKEEDPTYYIGIYRSKSGKYILIWNHSTLSSQFHVLPSNDPYGKFRPFTKRESKHEYRIYHYQDQFYIITNWKAKNFRLMKTPEDSNSKSSWVEIIPHRNDVLLEDLDIFQHFLVLTERENALTYLRVIQPASGEDHRILFDEPAYVVYTTSNFEFESEKLRFVYSSLTTPMSTYDYEMHTKRRELKKRQVVVGGHNPEEYTTERWFVPGRDNAKIPLTVVYHHKTILGKKTPILLYGYGSYGASMDPWFSSVRLSLLERGFVFAIAHIRGGQEMGRDWYEQGKLLSKENTFNDFVDCAQFLVKQEYTSSQHLYAMGGSAGGLLIGAAINQASQLFNGAIAAVPFVDVVTTMLDQTIPLTTNEYDEWGNPNEKEYYDYMLSYSPYDNVEHKNYPHLLVTTGYFDSQVQYWEPAKWVAKLRDMKSDDHLLLLHTNLEAGHGGASGRFRRYRETALEYAFLLGLEGIDQ